MGRGVALTVSALLLATAACSSSGGSHRAEPSAPSARVAATVTELPVPPTVPANGVCTSATGCISGAWGSLGSPGFVWDSRFVLLGVTYAGAPTSGPASVFDGPQVLLERTDGSTFPDGNAWRCLTCGVPDANRTGIVTSAYTYPPPHGLPDNKHALVGNGILECGDGGATLAISDPSCTPSSTHIYPIFWGDRPLGTGGILGNGREWRLSPDGVHLAWSKIAQADGVFDEFAFAGRLQFDAAAHRYDLTNVHLLLDPGVDHLPYRVDGNQLQFHPGTMVGELRGWTSDGTGVLGIQSYESASIDAWAVDLASGASRALTNHAEYTDPMFPSPDGKWLLAEEVAGTGRVEFISALQGLAAITDQLPTTGHISGIRNDVNRRYFRPWLVDISKAPVGERGTTKQVVEHVSGNPVVSDPDPAWNAGADPVWLADSSGVVWAENFACGANPKAHQCAGSTEPGGRNSRVLLARFPSLHASAPHAPAPITDTMPWTIPYQPGQALPTRPHLPAGTYTLTGAVHGSASVVITETATKKAIETISVTYRDFSDLPGWTYNGTESVRSVPDGSFTGAITWTSNLTLTGSHTGSRTTSADGFTLPGTIVADSAFKPTGTMTTTLDGKTYTQPAPAS